MNLPIAIGDNYSLEGNRRSSPYASYSNRYDETEAIIPRTELSTDYYLVDFKTFYNCVVLVLLHIVTLQALRRLKITKCSL